MNPSSSALSYVEPPDVSALATRSSTLARLSHWRLSRTSTALLVSQTALGVKTRNLACVHSIRDSVSLTTTHTASSPLNCGLGAKPSAFQKAKDRGTSATGRL